MSQWAMPWPTPLDTAPNPTAVDMLPLIIVLVLAAIVAVVLIVLLPRLRR